MTTLEPRSVTWIATQLEKVKFVTWDRFTVSERQSHTLVDVYGWIDREDQYKDFVWTRFYPDNRTFEYTTSSEERSQQLGKIWFEESADHESCQRVEDTFDIPNRVELQDSGDTEK